MANEAQKEPTMEEILASIKRIIAEEDGARPGSSPEKSVKPLSPGDILGEADIDEDDTVQDFGDAVEALAEDEIDTALEGAFDDLDFTDEDLTLPDDAEVEAEDEVSSDVFEQIVTGGAAEDDFDLDDLGLELTDELLDGEELEAELLDADDDGRDPVETVSDDVEALNEEDDLSDLEAVFEDNETLPEVPVRVDPAHEHRSVETMAKTAVKSEPHLTDDTSATAAANAMSKLLGRMDLGGENTVEGLVRQMLKPMLKEWLDANLARIVEAKVEEEVQRISRLAR